jgi:hypothetical protein
MISETRQLLLEIVVGRIPPAEVAAWLGVPVCVLADWLDGLASMPDAKFLQLTDLFEKTAQG